MYGTLLRSRRKHLFDQYEDKQNPGAEKLCFADTKMLKSQLTSYTSAKTCNES